MNIAKGLKVKNRLIGKITKQREIIQRENSRRNDNVSEVDVKKEFEVLISENQELIDLKTKISIASIPIIGKIIELQELKVFVNFIKSLPTREGIEKISYGQTTVIDYNWKSAINQKEKDTLITKSEIEINNLQDEIDTFNAVTSI